MRIEKVNLIKDDPSVTLTCYVADSYSQKKRDALLVIPGGGYGVVCIEHEGYPVAEAFIPHNFNCFVLTYSVEEKAKGHRPLVEASIAMQYIRENAEQFNIDPERVFCVGFSAGGHLAASLATMWHTVKEVPEGINRPTGAILCYPVLTGKRGHSHMGSFINLLGVKEPTDEQLEIYSLENHVDERTSPVFLMHTFDDNGVPVEGSFYFAEALRKHKIPLQMHIYPHGAHGASLANTITGRWYDSDAWNYKLIRGWVNEAAEWAKNIDNILSAELPEF